MMLQGNCCHVLKCKTKGYNDTARKTAQRDKHFTV